MAEKIEIFFCYAQEDEAFLQALEKQLSALRRENKINMWHSQNISYGADWRKEIDRHLDAAHVVLLLVSPDFLASDYCYSVELKRAMERHALGEAHVIPVILRPCDWPKTPFGKLQALPARAQPVTSWSDQDEAFFNVARGIRSVIERLIALKQTRNIALFGYEMQEGKASPLWADPSAFPLDEEAYTAWLSTKREISRGELIGQTWVKTSNPEHTFIVRFFDGGFSEYALSDPARQWQGSWELLDGKLRMEVNKYELDILANRERLVYSGIEFAQGEQKPHSYFVCFPLLDTDMRHWDLNEVPELVERIFDQVLRQRVEKKLLIMYGALLCRGEMTVRSLVKILGLSRTYQGFINLKKPQETIELLYATFLGREAGVEGKQLYTKEIQAGGSSAIVANLIDSEEYQTRFGEDAPPPRSAHANRAYWLKQLNLS